MHTERYTASRGKEVLLHTNLIATRKARPTNIVTISIVIISCSAPDSNVE